MGTDGINISLDTLRRLRYSALTENAELFIDCYQKLTSYMEEQGMEAFKKYFGFFL